MSSMSDVQLLCWLACLDAICTIWACLEVRLGSTLGSADASECVRPAARGHAQHLGTS